MSVKSICTCGAEIYTDWNPNYMGRESERSKFAAYQNWVELHQQCTKAWQEEHKPRVPLREVAE